MSKKDDLFNKKHLTQHSEILSMLKTADRKQKKSIDIRVLLNNKYFCTLLAAYLSEKEMLDLNDEESMANFRRDYSSITPENHQTIVHFIQKILGQEIYDDPTVEINTTEALTYIKSLSETK